MPRPTALLIAPLSMPLMALAGVTCLAASAMAQDLYDTSILRTVNIQFQAANWETQLRNNYFAQTNILADITVDGVTYPNVGVRIRGNTSYTALPAGSQKFSLNIDVDFTHPDQNIQGYKSLNFNNGFHDPTFCREVVYNNYVAQFMPNPRANHVVVTLNGANWGVYNNIQQFSGPMLSDWFEETGGLTIKCANNPSGPGLRYNGATQTGYTGYEIKDTGGLTDPWAPLIAVCNGLSNQPLATMSAIDDRFALDPSIWSVVFENLLTDDDSYVHKGADFMTYRDPSSGRMYLLQTDANETFTAATWSPLMNVTSGTATTKPFLGRVIAQVPEYRQRYLAHYRTAKADLTWEYFEPQLTALRNQIDAAVLADPKKLYSHTLFQQNFTTTVTLPYSGLAGGTLIGIQPFLTQRASTINAVAEVVANGPTISSVVPSDSSPDPADPVSVTATVAPNGSAVSRVDLFYRPSPSAGFSKVQMTSQGGNQYSATLPITATPGQRVWYYVGATAANTYSSLSFYPTHTEWDPMVIEYTFGATGGMRITEFMYSGASGEFLELTNISDAPISMAGWHIDDDRAVAGALSLTPFGTVMPGESVIVTDSDAEAFQAAWSLPASVKVIGGLGVVGGDNLSRNDDIDLFNPSNTVADRLVYGDQTYPGTVRAQNASAVTCRQAIGQNDIAMWRLSASGDVHGSMISASGDVGNPGIYVSRSCTGCSSDYNGDGDAGTDQDIEAFFACVGGTCCPTCDPNGSDFNQDGDAGTDQDIESFFRVLGGGSC